MRKILLFEQVTFVIRFAQCELRGFHLGPIPPLGAGAQVGYVMCGDGNFCANCGLNLLKLKSLLPLERWKAVADHVWKWKP